MEHQYFIAASNMCQSICVELLQKMIGYKKKLSKLDTRHKIQMHCFVKRKSNMSKAHTFIVNPFEGQTITPKPRFIFHI